jgi:RHS repeat-associated protein
VEEYDRSSTDQVSYVYGNDLIHQTREGLKTFYLVDGLGSTRLLTDVQGNVLNAYDYEAFGRIINQSGITTNQYLFAGEKMDQELGDYYLRDRFYDTTSGRFTRRDSYAGQIYEPITLHKYIYANNNSINGIDPSGFATLMEHLSSLSMLGSLSANLYTTALSVTAIDIAKAWAVIMGVAAFAVVLEEIDKAGDTSIRIVPDEQTAPEPKDKNKEPKYADDNSRAQMRLQLQANAPGHTFGIPIENISEVGVTVSQVGQAVLGLWQYRRSLAKWFPADHDTALLKAMAGVTKKAKASYPFGVYQGSSQVYSRQWNKNDSKGNRPVSRGYYRVDLALPDFPWRTLNMGE